MAEETISSAVQRAVTAASTLAHADLDFHRRLDSSFARELDGCLEHLLRLAQGLVAFSSDGSDIVLDDTDDLNNRWGDIVDVVDTLLEQTDTALDALRTKSRKEAGQQISTGTPKSEKEPLPANLRNAQDLVPPQLSFKSLPDNTDEPWRPLLTSKPNAKIALKEALLQGEEASGGHPYANEIETIDYPSFMFERKEPIASIDAENIPVKWVENKIELHKMLDELRNSREIAVDLEHHDFHSFRGFVCLMQISNRQHDWIVDTLALRQELGILNEVFTDPKILKVFHGAHSDIIWLQRDFGLYIVNLFDTYHASKVLGLEGHGLAFLLSKYVQFEADKRYQLADWRIRPLPKEMLFYARSDTHYLLYVYDLMRNELLDMGPDGDHHALASVLQASALVSMRRYYKEPYDAAEGQGSDGWLFLLNKFFITRSFGPQQLQVLKALHQWRDQTAREKDESTRFVMSNSAIVSIAGSMPRDLNSLLQATKQISSTMQSNLKTILLVIETAIQYANDHVEVTQAIAEDQVPIVPSANKSKARTIKQSAALTPASIDLLLSHHSGFWGSLESSLRIESKASPMDKLQLVVPVAALSEDIYQSINQLEKQEVTPEIGPSPKQEAEVFTVRQVGHEQAAKRKSQVLDLESSETPATSDSSMNKAARRKAKKEAKAASEAQDTKSVPEAGEEEVPFDYAAQAPIMKEREYKKQKGRVFGEYKGKIVRGKQIQGSKQSTFKRK